MDKTHDSSFRDRGPGFSHLRVLSLNEHQRPHVPGTLIQGVRGSYLVMENGNMRKVDILETNGTEHKCLLQKRLTRKEKKAEKRRRHK